MRGWLSIKYQAAGRSCTLTASGSCEEAKGEYWKELDFFTFYFLKLFLRPIDQDGLIKEGGSVVHTELRSCVEASRGGGRPGLPSLISLMVSVDVKHHERRRKSDTLRRSTDLKKMRGPNCFRVSDAFLSTKASQLSRITCL